LLNLPETSAGGRMARNDSGREEIASRSDLTWTWLLIFENVAYIVALLRTYFLP
jgi:hypothetical protein